MPEPVPHHMRCIRQPEIVRDQIRETLRENLVDVVELRIPVDLFRVKQRRNPARTELKHRPRQFLIALQREHLQDRLRTLDPERNMHGDKQRQLLRRVRIAGKIVLRADEQRAVLQHHICGFAVRFQRKEPAKAVFHAVSGHAAQYFSAVMTLGKCIGGCGAAPRHFPDHASASGCWSAETSARASASQASPSDFRAAVTGACRYLHGRLTASTRAPLC